MPLNQETKPNQTKPGVVVPTLDQINLFQNNSIGTLSAGAVEYTDCISAEG